MNSTDKSIAFVCRRCGITHKSTGNFTTSVIEIDSETLAEVDTIALVSECPDCWKD